MTIGNNSTVILLMVLAALLFYSCGFNTSSQVKETPKEFRLTFAQDSGYIHASDAFKLLLSNTLIDTTGGNADSAGCIQYAYSLGQPISNNTTRYYKYWGYKPTDTIGKYHIISSTGNYLAAISLDKDIMLLELTPQGKPVGYGTHGYNIYGHGNHPCCWENIDDILQKYDHYLGIATCGSGSAYCAKYVTFFKDSVEPLNNEPIPVSIFKGAWGNEIPGQILSSTTQLIKTDSLLMRYKLEEYIENGSGEMKIISTSHFTITYTIKNNRLKTDEKYKFGGIAL